jgi:hypothetical protein
MRLSDPTVLHFNSPAEPAWPAFSMAEPVAVRTGGGPNRCGGPCVRLSDATVLRFNSPVEPACIFYGRTGPAGELKCRGYLCL